MPASLNFLFPQAPPRIICYGQDLIACVVATDAYAWACPILMEVGTEVLKQACMLAVGWGARCISPSSYFGAADVL